MKILCFDKVNLVLFQSIKSWQTIQVIGFFSHLEWRGGRQDFWLWELPSLFSLSVFACSVRKTTVTSSLQDLLQVYIILLFYCWHLKKNSCYKTGKENEKTFYTCDRRQVKGAWVSCACKHLLSTSGLTSQCNAIVLLK